MQTTIAFAPASAPSGIAFYPNTSGVAFPQYAGGLLVVTSGSWNTTIINGYELWIVPFAVPDQPGTPIRLIPANTERSSSNAALSALSFFPDHPVTVAVSPEGWIYAATREGRVIRLRPRI
jgi:glucose/arabinose dehydrogenase